DGASFLTVSKQDVNQQHGAQILRYQPATSTVVPGPSGAAMASPAADTRAWWDKLSLEQITYMVAAVGIIGLLMVAGGVIGIRRSRKQQRQARVAGAGRARAQVPQWDNLPPDDVPAGYASRGDYGYDDRYDDYRGGGGNNYQGGAYSGGG